MDCFRRYFTHVHTCTTKYFSVLQSTTPVLLCTTKYNVRTAPLLQRTTQYYSVLQSTTLVLLCTTKYYASTTLYYKVLLCATKLLCTTKYYSSTTLYYKVLRQYYNVLRQYYNVLPSTTTYYSGTTLKRHLQCAEQQEAPSNFTKYCACHAK